MAPRFVLEYLFSGGRNFQEGRYFRKLLVVSNLTLLLGKPLLWGILRYTYMSEVQSWNSCEIPEFIV